ncbi:MAG TPA: site-2 protease family protein, partial [Phycisphaerae bacterium]|nr:site-2 protease family protein [Phycisphaerae bacterium]
MFGKSYQVFTFSGIPVRVDASWLLIVLLLTWSLATGVFPAAEPGLTAGVYWALGLLATLGLFASIVVHEFAHALVARSYGTPMKGITLFIFGGVAEMTEEPPSPRAEFFVAIAGPIASIVVAALTLGIAAAGTFMAWPRAAIIVFGYLAAMNALLVAFNLIPAFPLDGGRVLRSALWKWKQSLRVATRTTSRIGGGFGVALIILGVLSIITGNFLGGMWWVLIGLFLRQAAQMSYQQLLIRRVL